MDNTNNLSSHYIEDFCLSFWEMIQNQTCETYYSAYKLFNKYVRKLNNTELNQKILFFLNKEIRNIRVSEDKKIVYLFSLIDIGVKTEEEKCSILYSATQNIKDHLLFREIVPNIKSLQNNNEIMYNIIVKNKDNLNNSSIWIIKFLIEILDIKRNESIINLILEIDNEEIIENCNNKILSFIKGVDS